MGKLKEIKDGVASEHGFKDWEEMFRSYRQRNMPMLLAAKFDKVRCLFAKAVAEDALNRAAERVPLGVLSDNRKHEARQSILSTEINIDL